MAVRRLHNSEWGFDSNCFVCEPLNQAGLRIPFDHDEARGCVVAEFTLDDAFSGAPKFVHGGIVLAILDEAMAWATIAVGGKFAVTKETTTTFDHPVHVGRAYRVEAFLGETTDATMATRAHVLDRKDRRCAEARATFVVLSAATARAAIGDIAGENSSFLRDVRN
jgi:uncharacterized protein (TIGR00369 family)